jgi:flagellin-like protein
LEREKENESLARRAFAGVIGLVIAIAIALVLSSWTFTFWQGWLYLATFGTCVTLITLYLVRHDPELLQRRLNAGASAEKGAAQKFIQTISALLAMAFIIVPGVDHLLAWSSVPTFVILIGNLLVILGFGLVFLVFRENSFTSAIVDVEVEQHVVSTGPYAIVRHPMYDGALLIFLGTPIALGSWWGLILMVPITAAITARLLDEEKYLSIHLLGYEDYLARVQSRLLPGLW